MLVVISTLRTQKSFCNFEAFSSFSKLIETSMAKNHCKSIRTSLFSLIPDECTSDLGNVLPQVQCGNCGFATDTTPYPFLVAIGYNNSRGNFFYACDGVLINRLYVLVKLEN
jgi:hypothetical protein